MKDHSDAIMWPTDRAELDHHYETVLNFLFNAYQQRKDEIEKVYAHIAKTLSPVAETETQSIDELKKNALRTVRQQFERASNRAKYEFARNMGAEAEEQEQHIDGIYNLSQMIAEHEKLIRQRAISEILQGQPSRPNESVRAGSEAMRHGREAANHFFEKNRNLFVPEERQTNRIVNEYQTTITTNTTRPNTDYPIPKDGDTYYTLSVVRPHQEIVGGAIWIINDKNPTTAYLYKIWAGDKFRKSPEKENQGRGTLLFDILKDKLTKTGVTNVTGYFIDERAIHLLFKIFGGTIFGKHAIGDTYIEMNEKQALGQIQLRGALDIACAGIGLRRIPDPDEKTRQHELLQTLPTEPIDTHRNSPAWRAMAANFFQQNHDINEIRTIVEAIEQEHGLIAGFEHAPISAPPWIVTLHNEGCWQIELSERTEHRKALFGIVPTNIQALIDQFYLDADTQERRAAFGEIEQKINPNELSLEDIFAELNDFDFSASNTNSA